LYLVLISYILGAVLDLQGPPKRVSNILNGLLSDACSLRFSHDGSHGFISHSFAPLTITLEPQVHGMRVYSACLASYRLQRLLDILVFSALSFSALAGLRVGSGFTSYPRSPMDTIQQNLIPTFPTFPSTITIHHIRRRQAGEASRRLLGINPKAVGLSICLSTPPVTVDSIALATSSEVFLLKLDDCNHFPLPTLDLLSLSDKSTLVAFEMAQVALHIYRITQEHVRGLDLSTHLASSTLKPWSPSKIVTEKLSNNARKSNIDQLWEGGLEGGFRDVCLRAWLSAM